MKPRISMITLGVADMDRAVAFYRDGLGLPVKDANENVAFFKLNGSWLGLYGRDALADDASVPADGQGFDGVALAHNVATEADVETVLAEAEAAGAVITKPAQKAFWGGYHGYFKDPDGHLWEVAHNPVGWIGPEDED